MITTFAAVVLSSVLTVGEVATPNWQTDYSRAMTSAAAQGKPLAVFIGRGEAGYSQVVGGEIPVDAGQMLANNFVSVYVDTDTAAGKDLAGQFGLSNGLVISCKAGNVQALRHTGTVAPQALSGYLTKYSEPARVVTTTERVGEVAAVVPATTVVPAGAVFGGCANGRCGAVTPAFAPSYAPAPAFYPSFGGGCASGRCPTVR
jgi:hypothetical protein